MRILLVFSLLCVSSLAFGENLRYLVQEDETLSQILVEQGFPESYQLLSPVIEETLALNPHIFFIPNPDLLTAGDELVLPVNPMPRGRPVPVSQTEVEILGTVGPAARAVVTKGSYFLESAGKSREPSPAHSVFAGDTVVTRDSSVIRLQFVDGAVFSVGSNSRFRIDDYAYNEEPEARTSMTFRSRLSLLLGAVSGISGEIGSDARDDYRVETPLSTIGLRGTEYTARHCEESCGDFLGSSVAVTEGAVALANAAGERELEQGEFAQARSAEELSPVLPIPDGFLDLEADPGELELVIPWWQRLINLFI